MCFFQARRKKEAALAASPGRLRPLPPQAYHLYHMCFFVFFLFFSTWVCQWALVTPEDRTFPSRTSQLLLPSPLVHTDWLFLFYSSKPFSKLPCLWPHLQTLPSEDVSVRPCWLNNRCSHFCQDEIVTFNKPSPSSFLSTSLSFTPFFSLHFETAALFTLFRVFVLSLLTQRAEGEGIKQNIQKYCKQPSLHTNNLEMYKIK